MEEFLESEWARLETRISIRLVFDHKKAKTKKPNTMQFCFQLSWPHCCHVQPAVSTSLPRIWLLLPLKVCQLEWVSFSLVLPLCRVVVPTAAMFILHECTYKHIYTCVQLENSHTRLCVLSRFPPLNVVKMSKLQRCGMIPRWGLRSSVPSFQDLHVCHGFSLTHNWLLWKTEWLETHVYFPKVSDVFFLHSRKAKHNVTTQMIIVSLFCCRSGLQLLHWAKFSTKFFPVSRKTHSWFLVFHTAVTLPLT